MRKTILTTIVLLCSILSYAQTNSIVNCDFQNVINRLKNTLSPSNPSYPISLGNLQGIASSSSNPTDTCMFIDLRSKCPSLDSNNVVVICFDGNGIAEYSVINTLQDFSNGSQNSNNGFPALNSDEFFGSHTTIRNFFNSSILKFYGDSVALIEYSDYDTMNLFANNFTDFQLEAGANYPIPYINFVGKCDTCVERIIDEYLDEKNDSISNTPCYITNFSCDSPMSINIVGTNPCVVTIQAKSKGCGGIETVMGWTAYPWSAKTGGGFTPGSGVYLGGNTLNCPGNNLVFPTPNSTGNAYWFCVKIKCECPGQAPVYTECCELVCCNVAGPGGGGGGTKSASAKQSMVDQIELYPVPTKDKLNLSVKSSVERVVMVRLVNAIGMDVRRNFYSLVEGDNQFQFDLKDFAKGLYYLYMESNGLKEAKTFRIE